MRRKKRLALGLAFTMICSLVSGIGMGTTIKAESEALSNKLIYGSSTVKNGVFDIESNKITLGVSGGKMQTADDNINFAYMSVEGNFTLAAKISSLTTEGSGSNSKAMLMIRNGIEVTSPHISIGIAADKGFAETRLPNRSNSSITGLTAPTYFRITRVDSKYTLAYSKNGVDYTTAKSYDNTDNMGAVGSILNVGMAVCAATAAFEEVSIVDGNGNTIYSLNEGENSNPSEPTIISVTTPSAITVELGEDLNLPSTLNAIYSDGSEKAVAVEWEAVDTSTAGTKIIHGTISGFETGIDIEIVVVEATPGETQTELSPVNLNTASGQQGTIVYDKDTNTYTVSSNYGGFNVTDIENPSAMFFPNIEIDTEKYPNFVISAEVTYSGSVTGTDKESKYAGLMVRQNIKDGVITPYFMTALRPNGKNTVNPYYVTLDQIDNKEFGFVRLVDEANVQGNSIPNGTYTLKIKKVGNEFTAYIINSSGKIYSQAPVTIDMAGKVNVGIFVGQQGATFKNLKVNELDSTGNSIIGLIFEPSGNGTVEPEDETPAQISLEGLETYESGQDYLIEIISNEAGTVELEVNGTVVVSNAELQKSGIGYKYTYSISTEDKDSLTIFATVKDEAGNTSTAYIYAFKKDVIKEKDFTVTSTFNLNALEARRILEVETTVVSNKASAQAVCTIVALYDENGKQVNLAFTSESVNAGETIKLNAGFKLPSKVENHMVKVFVWDGTSIEDTSMQPLSNVVILQ